MAQTQEFIATGRRKTSVARIRMMPGTGKIDINGRSFEDYFPTAPLQNVVLQPLQTAKLVNSYDLSINSSTVRPAPSGSRFLALFCRWMQIYAARLRLRVCSGAIRG